MAPPRSWGPERRRRNSRCPISCSNAVVSAASSSPRLSSSSAESSSASRTRCASLFQRSTSSRRLERRRIASWAVSESSQKSGALARFSSRVTSCSLAARSKTPPDVFQFLFQSRQAITKFFHAHTSYPSNPSTNASASNGTRSSIFSPVPTKRTGNPNSRAMAKTIPPLAVLSNLASTTPVTSTAS